MYRNEPEKSCFQQDMTKKLKYLPKRTAFDKVLCEKTFGIVSNPKYDGYQCGLASILYKTFDKKDADTITQTGTGISVNLRISQ